MKIQLFTLCDFAQSNLGKLSIIGTFNRIFADKFPFAYQPTFFVVAKAMSVVAYEGKFDFTATDPNGEALLNPLSGDVKIDNPLGDNREKSFDFNIAITNQVFKMPGTYTFKFKIGDLEATQELYVEQKPTIATPIE